PNALAFVHQVECLVDVFQTHGVGDEGIQLELALEVVLDVAGQLGAAFDATEGGTTPDPTGDQLERTGADFFAGTGHPDNHRLTPALVAALQGRAHHVHVADTFEGVVHSAVGQINDHLLNGAVIVFGVNAVGGAQLLGDFELGRVDIDGDDTGRLRLNCTNDRGQANAAQTENGHRGTRLHFGGVADRADTRGDATTQQTD